MRSISSLALALLCAVSLAIGIGVLDLVGAPGTARAKAKQTDPRVFDLRKQIYGKSAAQWTEEWWQWAYSIPWDHNPIGDETGRWAAVGQRGPVWFLGGVYNESGVAVRTVTIPTERALFFPILNALWWNDPIDPPPLLTVEALRENASATVSEYDLASLIVTVDGADIRGIDKMRVATGPFEYFHPKGGVIDHFTGGAAGAGTRWPAVSDGYWCMLRPLSAGQHTVRFRGDAGSFALDVTYELTVVDHDRP